jgi:hypothetical protein
MGRAPGWGVRYRRRLCGAGEDAPPGTDRAPRERRYDRTSRGKYQAFPDVKSEHGIRVASIFCFHNKLRSNLGIRRMV